MSHRRPKQVTILGQAGLTIPTAQVGQVQDLSRLRLEVIPIIRQPTMVHQTMVILILIQAYFYLIKIIIS